MKYKLKNFLENLTEFQGLPASASPLGETGSQSGIRRQTLKLSLPPVIIYYHYLGNNQAEYPVILKPLFAMRTFSIIDFWHDFKQ